MSSFQRFLIYSGHLIENFDNMLYGFFAVFLSSVFFPADLTPNMQNIFSFLTFFAGFLSKPFGALFWGRVSDAFGRRIPLIFSMGLMGIPTLVIGFLPTYEDIGLVATFTLIFCRIMQGFFIGGEFSSAAIYMMESGEKSKQGARIYDLIGSGVLGAVIATLIGSVSVIEGTPNWAWRMPFIFGGVVSLLIFILRMSIKETDDFEKSRNVRVVPVRELFSFTRLPLMIMSSLIFGVSAVSLYLATIYGNSVYREIGFSDSGSLLINTYALVVSAITIFVVGRFFSLFSYYQIIVFGLLSSIVAGFLGFLVISVESPGIFHVFFYVTLLSVFGSINVGAFYPYFSSFFKVRERHTALAILSTVGPSIISGITPFVAEVLRNKMGGDMFAPFYWILFVYSLALVSIFYINSYLIKK